MIKLTLTFDSSSAGDSETAPIVGCQAIRTRTPVMVTTEVDEASNVSEEELNMVSNGLTLLGRHLVTVEQIEAAESQFIQGTHDLT